MLVKICGLRTSEHALAATAAGADILGLVFAPSKRQVTVEQAAAIAAIVRAAPARPRLAGLFVNAAPAAVNAIAAQVGLDLVQLSGDEPVAHADLIDLPIIKAVRMGGSAHEAAWIARYDGRRATGDEGRPYAVAKGPSPALILGLSPLIFLVDAHVPGSYGGTGVVADWGRAAELAARAPTLLAGGLTPANVAAAIAAVRPLGVDVSSGVEHNGIKDPARIEAFLGAVRAAQP
ncbi:MAG: phosphoribosylanthranilate isomerase [Chloroflexales bacterium]|nr:phosphoribosylanthranilate isomerase [Chloroflexales bacterium]